MNSKNTNIRIGISMGDPNGIGMEVIIKTFMDSRILDFYTPIIYGSSKITSFYQKSLQLDGISFHQIKNEDDAQSKRLNLINCVDKNIQIEPGNATEISGHYAYKSLEMACNGLKNKKIDVLITAPINKLTINKKIANFIGHTEYLGKNFEGSPLMLMVSDYMKIALVTTHVPVIEIKNNIHENDVYKKIQLLNKTLIQDFGINKPKIAVLGLNPHAGEGGMLGNEEEKIIIPAIEKSKGNNILAFGPYPADSFFTDRNLKAFDAILAMYHDQGLTPFKTLSFNNGVNYTAGLDIIRTSPVHGTAYEIAGKNKADEQSFREAIYLACDIFKQRKHSSQIAKAKSNLESEIKDNT